MQKEFRASGCSIAFMTVGGLASLLVAAPQLFVQRKMGSAVGMILFGASALVVAYLMMSERYSLSNVGVSIHKLGRNQFMAWQDIKSVKSHAAQSRLVIVFTSRDGRSMSLDTGPFNNELAYLIITKALHAELDPSLRTMAALRRGEPEPSGAGSNQQQPDDEYPMGPV